MCGTLPEILWWCWPRSWGWGWRWWEGGFVSRAEHAGKEKNWHFIMLPFQKHRSYQEVCKCITHILLLRGIRAEQDLDVNFWDIFLRTKPQTQTNLNLTLERLRLREENATLTVTQVWICGRGLWIPSSWELPRSLSVFLLFSQGLTDSGSYGPGLHGKQDSHLWLYNTAPFQLQC